MSADLQLMSLASVQSTVIMGANGPPIDASPSIGVLDIESRVDAIAAELRAMSPLLTQQQLIQLGSSMRAAVSSNDDTDADSSPAMPLQLFGITGLGYFHNTDSTDRTRMPSAALGSCLAPRAAS